MSIPESINIDFEDFCKECNFCEAKVENAALYSGNEKAQVIATLTCEHINLCRKLWNRLQEKNKTETGRVFAEFYDGSWRPVKADKNGIVYVE